jgi:hypothetical protein
MKLPSEWIDKAIKEGKYNRDILLLLKANILNEKLDSDNFVRVLSENVKKSAQEK